MKNMYYLFISLVILFSLYACDNQNRDNDGKAPEIGSVNFYAGENEEPTRELPSGEKVWVSIYIEDCNLDMKYLHVSLFQANAPDYVYDGPNVYVINLEFPLAKIYITREFLIEYPPGDYEVELQVEDERGNYSRKWRMSVTVI